MAPHPYYVAFQCAFIAALGTASIAGIRYIQHRAYDISMKSAEPYIIRDFGDHQPPLTSEELREFEKSVFTDPQLGLRGKMLSLREYTSKASTRPHNDPASAPER